MPLSDREIALLSVGVAASVGLVNILYTMSKLRVVTKPQVYASMELDPNIHTSPRVSEADPDIHKYHLKVDIKNLSTQTSISDIYYSIEMTRRRRFWQFWRRKELYGGRTIQTLDPQQSASATLKPPDSYVNNLTAFVHSSFYPNVLQSLGDEYSHDSELTYALISSKHLVLVLTVSYAPGVIGARVLKLRRVYHLVPRHNSKYLSLDLASDKRLIELVPPIKRELKREVRKWSKSRLLAADSVDKYSIKIDVLRGWSLLRES